MIITREIVNKDIKIYNIIEDKWDNYSSLCIKINQIKNTLLQYGAVPGDRVALIQTVINLNHIASVFACLELGLKLIVADMPATKESLPYCKMSLCGPVKFTLYNRAIFADNFENIDGRPWHDMIFNYSEFAFNEKEFSTDASPTPILATDNTIGLISSSSGTTDWSKTIDFTHSEIYMIAKRNVDLFSFKKTDIVAQTKNLHHGGSLLISFLPSLMACDTHLSTFMPDYKNHFDASKKGLIRAVKTINIMGCNRITITNYDTFEHFLELVNETIGKFDNTLTVIPFVFKATPRLFELANMYNIEIHNTYGSIDSQMIPLSINKITGTGIFTENYVGDWVNDNFYSVHSIDDNGVHTFKRVDGKLCTIQDSIEIKDGKVYLYARAVDENHSARQQVEKYITADFSIVQNGSERYLALFEDIEIPVEIKNMDFKNILTVDKSLFFAEAKINYDALRGHFIYFDQSTEYTARVVSEVTGW